MSIRPFVMLFRLSCAYLIYDADAALPHLNPRKRRRGGIFIYEKRDHCIISCNSLFIFLINANLLTLPFGTAPTSYEPLTTNNKKSTSRRPTYPAESRVSLSGCILSHYQVARFGISDSHGFARRKAPSKPVPCLSQGTLVG